MYVLIYIAATLPSGSFMMGRDGDRADEVPRHEVHLSAFTLDDTLVTVADFAAFVRKTHYVTSAERQGYGMVARAGMGEWEWQISKGASWRRPAIPVQDDYPVTMVSHYDAVAYCRAQGKRLPTEAEWEYAMRAGATTRFPWGDSPLNNGRFGLNFWQDPRHDTRHNRPSDNAHAQDGYTYLSPVRAFAPNAWGIYDPVGNVWQLVNDYYGRYEKGPVRNPQGAQTGTHRVSRGGSWWCSAHTCEAYGLFYRGKALPEAPFNNVGFRCAQSL